MKPRTNRARIVLVATFLCLTLTAHAQSASVETVQFQSKLTNATLPYNVILPPDYRAASATRYPVLYLLHGFGGHYSDWATRTNVADYAAQYRMIVVMPEGNNSWYTDSAGMAIGQIRKLHSQGTDSGRAEALSHDRSALWSRGRRAFRWAGMARSSLV